MFKKIAIAATLAVLSTTAMAAEGSRFYAGADVGTTKIEGESDRENSAGAFVGFNITPVVAIEAGFRRLADYDIGSGANRVELTMDQIALSAVATLPLNSGFNVFGRLGYNRLNAKASVSGFKGDANDSGVLYGIGAGYAFSPTVAARIEVQKPSSDSTNLSAGVVFSF